MPTIMLQPTKPDGTPINLFPTLTKTVATKDGLHVEWTDAGKMVINKVLGQTSIFSRLFPREGGLSGRNYSVYN